MAKKVTISDLPNSEFIDSAEVLGQRIKAKRTKLADCAAESDSINELDQKLTPIFRELAQDELIARLDQKEEFGLLTWDDKPQLSVAGVQDKLNVFIDDKTQTAEIPTITV